MVIIIIIIIIIIMAEMAVIFGGENLASCLVG